jgi:hypothetical protein
MNRYILPVAVLAGLTLFTQAQGEGEDPATSWSSEPTRALGAFNPAISAIVDMFYYYEDSEEGISHIKEELPGFATHAHGEDEHEHGEVENGFNLREVELAFSAEVDAYFKALAMVAVSEDGAEIEEAWGETTSLPWGFRIKAGKIFSDFGYINNQHPHQWDFSDRPLIYELALGDHGLSDVGGQVSWLAPTPVYLLFGAEALQGDNEKMFAQQGGDDLPENDGPRLGVGWVKLAPVWKTISSTATAGSPDWMRCINMIPAKPMARAMRYCRRNIFSATRISTWFPPRMQVQRLVNN